MTIMDALLRFLLIEGRFWHFIAHFILLRIQTLIGTLHHITIKQHRGHLAFLAIVPA